MHMVVKAPLAARAAPALQPASLPTALRGGGQNPHSSPATFTPSPPAAASPAAGASAGSGPVLQQVASSGPPYQPYQPDATSAWMQYQNTAVAWGTPPWAMPQVCICCKACIRHCNNAN